MNDAPLHEGNTAIGEHTLIQIMLLPVVESVDKQMKLIAKGKMQLEKWTKKNHCIVTGWSHMIAEVEGKQVMKLTMYAEITKPELAYKGRYPVYEHEKEAIDREDVRH